LHFYWSCVLWSECLVVNDRGLYFIEVPNVENGVELAKQMVYGIIIIKEA